MTLFKKKEELSDETRMSRIPLTAFKCVVEFTIQEVSAFLLVYVHTIFASRITDLTSGSKQYREWLIADPNPKIGPIAIRIWIAIRNGLQFTKSLDWPYPKLNRGRNPKTIPDRDMEKISNPNTFSFILIFILPTLKIVKINILISNNYVIV